MKKNVLATVLVASILLITACSTTRTVDTQQFNSTTNKKDDNIGQDEYDYYERNDTYSIDDIPK